MFLTHASFTVKIIYCVPIHFSPLRLTHKTHSLKSKDDIDLKTFVLIDFYTFYI